MERKGECVIISVRYQVPVDRSMCKMVWIRGSYQAQASHGHLHNKALYVYPIYIVGLLIQRINMYS